MPTDPRALRLHAIRWPRAACLAAGMVIAAALAWLLYHGGPRAMIWPECLFYRLTGGICPGCGMTRAVHALLHGRWDVAFRFNPLGVALLPLVMAAAGVGTARWLCGRPLGLARVRPGWWFGLVVVVVVYWILRNIPVWPLTLLAPH